MVSIWELCSNKQFHYLPASSSRVTFLAQASLAPAAFFLWAVARLADY